MNYGDNNMNDYNDTLKEVAKLMNERIKNMQKVDISDGKTNTPLSEYIFWALEEVCENDGVTIEINKFIPSL